MPFVRDGSAAAPFNRNAERRSSELQALSGRDGGMIAVIRASAAADQFRQGCGVLHRLAVAPLRQPAGKRCPGQADVLSGFTAAGMPCAVPASVPTHHPGTATGMQRVRQSGTESYPDPKDPSDGQPASPDATMALQRLQRIGRTAWLKPAMHSHKRTAEYPVGPDRQRNQPGKRGHVNRPPG